MENDYDFILNDPEEGIFVCQTANEWLEQAASRPNPRPLWHSLWFEGECRFNWQVQN